MQTILIVDDHPLILQGVSHIVAQELPGCTLETATNFDDVILLVSNRHFDLVILDLDIPGSLGVGMVRRLLSIRSELKILVYSGMGDANIVVQVLMAGAYGYLSKMDPSEEMAIAIERIASGGKYVADRNSQHLLSILSSSKFELAPAPPTLSKRENEVLKMLLDGKWVKEIASDLKLSNTTVSTYKSRIFEKMGVSSVPELVKKVFGLENF